MVKPEEIESNVYEEQCIVAEKGAFYDELVIELNGGTDFLLPSSILSVMVDEFTPGDEIIYFACRSYILGNPYDVLIFRSEESRTAYIESTLEN